jgi:hypothetical protein
MTGTQVRCRSHEITRHGYVCLVGERNTRVEAAPRGAVDFVLVIMPERVARKGVRISLAVNLRFPGAGHSAQGQSGPKTRSKDVVDGRLVNIPAPLFSSEGVTEQ